MDKGTQKSQINIIINEMSRAGQRYHVLWAGPIVLSWMAVGFVIKAAIKTLRRTRISSEKQGESEAK